MELTRVPSGRVADHVCQALRQAILSRLLRPGERLDVQDLTAKLGVSATPVRQAIQQLFAEGLIEVRPRSGTFVARLSPRDVEETFQIRAALECLAAETAVKRIKAAQLARMKQLLARMSRPVTSPESQAEHEQDNAEFHGILIEASGNRRLREIYRTLNAHIQIARIHRSHAEWCRRADREQREHTAILRALQKRDAPALCEALRRHIRRAAQDLVASLDQAADGAPGR